MRTVLIASVASMHDQFNRENIKILQEIGYEVDLIANFQVGNTSSQARVQAFMKEMQAQNVRCYDVPIPRKISAIKDMWNSYRTIKRIQEERQYDLAHMHSPIGGVLGRLAMKKARKNGTRVIYTAHGFHFYRGASLLNWLVFMPIEKFLSRYMDILVTICKEDYINAAKFGIGKHICLIPGIGIDVEKIKHLKTNRDFKAELGISEDSIMILSIGELNRNKNHETVLRAIASLPQKELHYVICGQGDQKQHLEQLAKELGLEGRLHLLGFREDAKEWLTQADIFAFPSFREGLPVSLMEAMAVGLPVVASRVRGNVDLIKEEKGGFLLQPNDVEGFAHGLQLLCVNRKLCKKMGAYNQKAVEAFDKSNTNRVMKRIYQGGNGKQEG